MLPYLAIASLILVTAYSAFASFKEPATLAGQPAGAARRSTLARIVILVLSVVGLFGMAAWFFTTAKETERRSSRFIIPNGFVGWVRIEFEVPGAPTIPLIGQEYVLKVPPSGVLQTSSKEPSGWAFDHYAYCDAQGKCRELPNTGTGGAGQIWGRMSGQHLDSSGNKIYEEFFVGSEDQFKEQLGGKNPT
jgi:hypothetical protein